MSDPIRAAPAPNSRDKSEIVIGYTQASPSPATLALKITPHHSCDKTSPPIPAQATNNPPCTNRTSSIDRSASGATHLPNISAA